MEFSVIPFVHRLSYPLVFIYKRKEIKQSTQDQDQSKSKKNTTRRIQLLRV